MCSSDLERYLFVGDALHQRVFEHMRERAVPHIVEEHCRHCRCPFVVGDSDTFLPQIADSLFGEVHSSDGVKQTSVDSSRVNEMAHTQLLDASESLHVRMLQDVEEQVVRYANESEDRVVDYFSFAWHVMMFMSVPTITEGECSLKIAVGPFVGSFAIVFSGHSIVANAVL